MDEVRIEDLRDPRRDPAQQAIHDRVAAQVAAVAADTGLSGLGRHMIRQRLVGLLASRLRFEDFVRRHPEALDVDLQPPARRAEVVQRVRKRPPSTRTWAPLT